MIIKEIKYLLSSLYFLKYRNSIKIKIDDIKINSFLKMLKKRYFDIKIKFEILKFFEIFSIA